MEDQQIEAEGTLQQIEEAAFRQRYGTEWALLDEQEDEIAYALKSDTEELEEYAGQHVRLSGFLVEGFPQEPEEPGYISITQINEAYHPE